MAKRDETPYLRWMRREYEKRHRKGSTKLTRDIAFERIEGSRMPDVEYREELECRDENERSQDWPLYLES